MEIPLYTRKQIVKRFRKNPDTVNAILADTPPEGMLGRWVGWSEATFKKAMSEYYSRMGKADEPSFDENISDNIDDPDLERKKLEVDIRWREQKAKLAELENQEREGLLISREDVQKLLTYQSQLFADKLKELCKTDEEYNMVVAEIYADLENYIERKDNSFMQQEEMELVKNTLDNPNVAEQDDPEVFKEVDQLELKI